LCGTNNQQSWSILPPLLPSCGREEPPLLKEGLQSGLLGGAPSSSLLVFF
jgi:hypothetical protein